MLVLLAPCAAALLQMPPPRSTVAQPGTSALSSPPGFETEYDTLRQIRQSTGKPLLRLSQLERYDAGAAARLSQRVNFNVPRTQAQAVVTFFSHPTARFISAALACAVAWRGTLGAPTLADAAAGLVTAAFWVVQEWLIHDKLLHSANTWFGEQVHRWHHELPYYHVSLDGLGLAAVWFATVGALLIGLGLVTSTLAPCLTALAVYTLCGGVYEAAHYLAHTPVPLPKWLQRVRRHHTLHHTLNSDYWLAFTVPAVDSLFGTNPPPRQVSRAMRQRAHAGRRGGGASRLRMMCDGGGSERPDDGAAASRSIREQVPGLIQMSRPTTIPMGAGLVGLGAWGARHTALQAASGVVGRLALGVALTVIVTSGSMLINDYHDYKLGVDTAETKPGRPLVTGEVRPDCVKLVLKYAYALHLFLLCLVDTAYMRLWILANTIITCHTPEPHARARGPPSRALRVHASP